MWADCPAIACHFLRSGHQLRPFLLVPSLDEGHCPQCVSLSLTVVAHRKTCFSPSSLNSTHSVRVHSADTRTRGLTRERGDKSVPKVELTRPHGSRTVGIAARASESCSLRTRPRTLPSQQPVSPVPATLCVAGSPHRELTGGNTTSEGRHVLVVAGSPCRQPRNTGTQTKKSLLPFNGAVQLLAVERSCKALRKTPTRCGPPAGPVHSTVKDGVCVSRAGTCGRRAEQTHLPGLQFQWGHPFTAVRKPAPPPARRSLSQCTWYNYAPAGTLGT